MDKMKVEDYLTDEGKILHKTKEKTKEQTDRIIKQSYEDTHAMMDKFQAIYKEYLKEESIFTPSTRTMLFMRAVNGIAHVHFKTHVNDLDTKISKKLIEEIQINVAREIADEECNGSL